jgi:transcription termination factor Rho
VSDTDLITADGSSDNVELTTPVTSDDAQSETAETPKIETPAGGPDAPVATDSSGAEIPARERPASLSAMVLPDLRALANEVGVKGASGMRKSELIAAIREQRGDTNGSPKAEQPATSEPTTEPAASEPTVTQTTKAAEPAPADTSAQADGGAEAAGDAPPRARRERRGANRQAGAPESGDDAGQTSGAGDTSEPKRNQQNKGNDGDGGGNNRNANNQGNANKNNGNNQNQNNQNRNNQDNQNQNNQNDDDDDGDGRQGRRGRRFRDRRRRGERAGGEGGGADRDTELREDDVVQPVAGILDVLDNYAFVRTSGYLAGPNDVYVSMNMVRKNGLRRGDAVTGAVRVAREGEGGGGQGGGNNPRQKFNPLVRLDTVNGGPVEDARNRPDFTKLTPLYPNQRLRLETTPDRLTTRIIDLIMPIGKGQRALIVSPPKAGKTTILQDIANAITVNNPECHLMVVLVDERPEEVTDMQRSVKGEVIASTFDRPPSDHTQAAELAIERAKRLVEQGRDVVVLLDSITRLGRAYNNASPASGRILSGGVDSTALYPPKRFLGAARNIEFGGSLTIIATAMVETGSTGDTVIFEEFKGTGNAELKLDRKISERRVFPAVDVNPSGTRKDELLLSSDEFGVVHKLRRVLSGLDSHQAIDLLMSQLRKTKTNYEFLVQVSKTTPQMANDD